MEQYLRSEEEMVMANMGSRGPWCPEDVFQLDFNTISRILNYVTFTKGPKPLWNRTTAWDSKWNPRDMTSHPGDQPEVVPVV